MSNNRVLVTGASGYLGVACIAAALNAGYRVRGTLRSMRRVGEVRAMVTAAGADPSDIEFVEADLLADAGSVTELRPASGVGLEDMFLQLTADTSREGAVA